MSVMRTITVKNEMRAWTGAFNVPYTLKGQLCSVRKLPVRGPRASPVARSVPMHKTTVLSEGCPLSARKSDILVESARQARMSFGLKYSVCRCFFFIISIPMQGRISSARSCVLHTIEHIVFKFKHSIDYIKTYLSNTNSY